jgi:hypothetical protein
MITKIFPPARVENQEKNLKLKAFYASEGVVFYAKSILRGLNDQNQCGQNEGKLIFYSNGCCQVNSVF